MSNNVWLCGKTQVDLSIPIVAGIINLTDDSFWVGSRVGADYNLLITRAEQMIEAGARIIDLGAESTRPGSVMVNPSQQIELLVPAIELLRSKFPDPEKVLISVDCYHYDIAKSSLDAGANIINDISGLQWENNVLPVLKNSECGYVLMHIKGTPQTMQNNPTYKNVINEVKEYFTEKLAMLKEEGINLERVVLDPGIGFGKLVEHNLQLIKNSAQLSVDERPLYFGISRKSFLGKILENQVEDRLNGTTAIHMLLLASGVKILRVHDVKEAIEAVKLWQAIKEVN